MMHEMRNPPNQTHAQELVTLRTGRPVAELLQDLYVVQRKSQAVIADELGISRMTVAMWLREHGISRGDAAREIPA